MRRTAVAVGFLVSLAAWGEVCRWDATRDERGKHDFQQRFWNEVSKRLENERGT